MTKEGLLKKIGIFDVDSRELGQDGLSLVFQERMLPFAGKLNRLYDFGYKRQLMFVFTVCCSGRFLKKDSLDYVCYVPMDKKDESWIENIANRRYFYIEKKQYGNPRINCENCAYDFFKYNGNALKLFEILGIGEWAVFGNGFDICTRAACRHLLKNGFKLILIKDAVAPAYGPGKIGTEENKKAIIEELKKEGAKTMRLDEFLKKYDKGE